MTLLDARPAADTDPASASVPPWAAALAGVVAALISLALVVGPVLSIWAGDPRSGGTWQQALGLACAAWIGTLGGHVALDGFVVSFVPLLLVAIPVGCLACSWSWVVARRPIRDRWVADLLPRRVLLLMGAWWAGYAVVLGAAAWLTVLGPARIAWPWLPLAVLSAPVAGLIIGTAWAARTDGELLGARLDGSRLPDWVTRAVGPALRGVGALLLLGAAVLALAMALRWDQVRAVQAAVGGGSGASIGLSLVQIAALPNLALWALSFLAGPGFSVVQGASVTWSGASTGLMPLIPVLGAHPDPGSFPWFMPALALLPAAVGALIGRWALRRVARLSALGTKLRVAVTASVLAALLTALLDVFGGSALGRYRLADIGAPAGWLLLALTLELVVGALLVVLHDGWKLRR